MQQGEARAMETRIEQASTGGRPTYIVTSTLLRQRTELNHARKLLAISDDDLYSHIADILRRTPFARESLIRGSLLSRGIFTPRQRVVHTTLFVTVLCFFLGVDVSPPNGVKWRHCLMRQCW